MPDHFFGDARAAIIDQDDLDAQQIHVLKLVDIPRPGWLSRVNVIYATGEPRHARARIFPALVAVVLLAGTVEAQESVWVDYATRQVDIAVSRFTTWTRRG